MKFIAFTTKGLEGVVKEELTKKHSASIIAIGNKRIIFETDTSYEKLTELKTVDDAGILVCEEFKIKSLDQLKNVVSVIDLKSIREFIQQFRILKDTFSTTASIASSSLKPRDVIEIIKDELINKYSWNYTEFDHSNFDIRVFIDKQTLILSVRLTQKSLHHRAFKTNSIAGSLKPTVAAAMVQLATDFKEGLKIVDNFCGSGTILCESVLLKNEVWGSDINPESTVITKSNLKNLAYSADDRVKVQDATKTNWPDNFFDCAISNLPWDKQIEVSSITSLYEDSIKEFARILKPNGTLCVLVSKPELFIKHSKKYFPNKEITQCKIGLLGQNPSIVLIK